MSETNGGFSFGAPPENPNLSDDDTIEEVDAIEVTGEPVSRVEAQKLGFANFATTPEYEKKAASISARLDPLPESVDAASAGKLERAWEHLKRNEIEEALTLAQEAAWEHPSLAAAKLIIARCFINRREYDKGLKILAAIPEEDRTDESMYYQGLCLSRLGRAKDAIDILRHCHATSSNPLLQKRANDLLLNLQGEKITCPVCGKKYLYDSLVESGNRLVCVTCAKKTSGKNAPVAEDAEDKGTTEDEEEDGDVEVEGATRQYGKRRKRLRPPLSRTDIMLRAVFALFLVLVIGFIIYLLYLFAPMQYSWLYSLVPVQYNLLPSPPPFSSGQSPSADGQGGTFLTFSSPPLKTALPKIPLRHSLRVGGAGNLPGEYGVSFSPAPIGPYTLNKGTGAFLWTPDADDAGKTFEITFSATIAGKRTLDQISAVRVGKGPEFRRLAETSGLNPTQIAHLLVEDMDNDGKQEILLVSGEYWNGDIVVFQTGPDNVFQEQSRIRLSGRPAAAGVISVENERWLAVADYWHARIRFFVLRGGRLSEVAVAINLPGQPILADFSPKDSRVTALCRVKEEMRLVAYRQEKRLDFELMGNWSAPEDNVWRRLMLADATEMNPVVAVLAGGEYAESLFAFEAGQNAPRAIKTEGDGALINAAPFADRTGIRCLTEQDGRLSIHSPNLSGPAGARPAAIPAGSAPALCGLITGGFTAAGAQDVLLLSTSRLGIAAEAGGENIGPVAFWPLPEPARLFGPAAVLHPPEKGLDEAVFLGESGTLWAMRMESGVGG